MDSNKSPPRHPAAVALHVVRTLHPARPAFPQRWRQSARSNKRGVTQKEVTSVLLSALRLLEATHRPWRELEAPRAAVALGLLHEERPEQEARRKGESARRFPSGGRSQKSIGAGPTLSRQHRPPTVFALTRSYPRTPRCASRASRRSTGTCSTSSSGRTPQCPSPNPQCP